jgi:hypothetical protein
MCTSNRRPRITCPCLHSCTTQNHEYRKSGASWSKGVSLCICCVGGHGGVSGTFCSIPLHPGCFNTFFEHHYRLPSLFVLYILTTPCWAVICIGWSQACKKTPHVLCLVGGNPGEDSAVCGGINIDITIYGITTSSFPLLMFQSSSHLPCATPSIFYGATSFNAIAPRS